MCWWDIDGVRWEFNINRTLGEGIFVCMNHGCVMIDRFYCMSCKSGRGWWLMLRVNRINRVNSCLFALKSSSVFAPDSFHRGLISNDDISYASFPTAFKLDLANRRHCQDFVKQSLGRSWCWFGGVQASGHISPSHKGAPSKVPFLCCQLSCRSLCVQLLLTATTPITHLSPKW